MSGALDGVVARLRERLAPLERTGDPARFFLATYLRTTRAVASALEHGLFEDPAWVEWWDAVFADLYLDALDAHLALPGAGPRPWRIAFAAGPDTDPVRHVLLGMNAHINYDLPQALVAVISPSQFADPVLLARRERDHCRIDDVLAARVAAEDGELLSRRGLADRALSPINRAMSRRLLRESRRLVWANARALDAARAAGDDVYRRRVAELDVLASARVRDLARPGPVLLRLGSNGFGVALPPL